jgi:preprotein translocase SecE subunit
MSKVKDYIGSTVEEMRDKVSWPSYTDLQRSSVLVLIGSLVFALVVGAMDFVYDKALIISTPGVIGFLGAGGSGETSKKPVPLRQSEINRILGTVDEAEEQTEVLDTPFIVGEMVKVMDGPFSGFSGTVEEVFEERKKLNVMVKIFGRNTPVELNYMQVEKES